MMWIDKAVDGPVVHLKNSCSTLREFEPTTFQFALIIITNAFLMH